MGLPVVTGVLAGAGLFGRELERGTHVLALTRFVGRGRWFGTGLLVAAFGPLSTPTFETTGLVPVGYAVLAFCVVAAAGLVPARAASPKTAILVVLAGGTLAVGRRALRDVGRN